MLLFSVLEAKLLKYTKKRGYITCFSGIARPQVAGSDRKWSKFNPAHQEPFIEVQYVSVTLREPDLVKTLKKGIFYVFFRFYGTGSDRTQPEVPNFNSAHQTASIEVLYASVRKVEAK